MDPFWGIFGLGFWVDRGALGPLVALFRTPFVLPGHSFCSVRRVMKSVKARTLGTSKRAGKMGHRSRRTRPGHDKKTV